MNPEAIIHLDATHYVSPVLCEHNTPLGGYMLSVDHGDDQPCRAVVWLCPRHNVIWNLVSSDPLTITDSVRMTCHHGVEHGFITEGKWLPCGDSMKAEHGL